MSYSFDKSVNKSIAYCILNIEDLTSDSNVNFSNNVSDVISTPSA